ncbi:MAG: DUF308 domain-containing protein [Eubacteriales bacterium]|nr:DUF308 domain-containing protein [Eubacteriales bacterium]
MKEKSSIIIMSLAEILVGILLLVNPVGLTTWILMAFGIGLILFGAYNIIQYFRLPAGEAAMKKSLAAGILAVLIGLWFVLRNDWLIALFPLLTTLYGVGVLVNGVLKIQWAADMVRLKRGQWVWMALSAAVTLICAAVILAHPFSTTAALWIFIGISMIVEAVIDIMVVLFKKGKK